MIERLKRLLAILFIAAIIVPSVVIAADENPPNSPTGLAQTSDSTTAIATGSTVSSPTAFVHANVSASSNGTLFLEAELRKTDTPFGFVPTHSSAPIDYTQAPNTVRATIQATGLSEGNYHWQVRTRNGANLVSNWVAFGGNSESAADFRVDFPPGVPTAVKANTCQDGCPATHSVRLTWVNPSDSDLQSIEIFRSTDLSSSGTKIATVDRSLESFFDTTVAEGTIYYYRLRGVDAAGTPGALSEPVSTVTNIEITDADGSRVTKTCPIGSWLFGGQESNVSIAGQSSGCDITYRPNIATEAVYEVFVNWVTSPDPNPFVAQPQATDARYSVTANGVIKEFIVDQTKRADGSPAVGTNVPSGFHKLGTFVFPAGMSSSVRLVASSTGYVVADQDRFVYIRPVPPANLTATDQPNDNGNEIVLTWTASASATTTAYNIYRATTAGNYPAAPLATVTGTRFVDASVPNGTTFFYVVRATDRVRESTNSNETSGVALDNQAPDRPTINSVEVGDGFVVLHWTPSPGAVGYLISYRDPAREAGFHSVFVSGGATSSVKITDLSNDIEHEFGIASVDAAGNQSAFNTVTATPKPHVVAPVARKVTIAGTAIGGGVTTPPAPEPQAAPSAEEEGKIKAADTVRERNQRIAVTLAILIIAVAAGVAGYYGYDWWLRQSSEKPPRGRRNGRW